MVFKANMVISERYSCEPSLEPSNFWIFW